MHNTVIVVCSIEVWPNWRVVFHEIVFISSDYVLPLDMHVVIAIVCTLHVKETECCKIVKVQMNAPIGVYLYTIYSSSFAQSYHENAHEQLFPIQNIFYPKYSEPNPKAVEHFDILRTKNSLDCPKNSMSQNCHEKENIAFHRQVLHVLSNCNLETYLILNIRIFISSLYEFNARNRFDDPMRYFDIKLLFSGVVVTHFIHDGFVWPTVLCVDQAISRWWWM